MHSRRCCFFLSQKIVQILQQISEKPKNPSLTVMMLQATQVLLHEEETTTWRNETFSRIIYKEQIWWHVALASAFWRYCRKNSINRNTWTMCLVMVIFLKIVINMLLLTFSFKFKCRAIGLDINQTLIKLSVKNRLKIGLVSQELVLSCFNSNSFSTVTRERYISFEI